MKQKTQRAVLLMAGLALAHAWAWAGPRSFRQAQAIAERQATVQGINMSQQAIAKARKRFQANGNGASSSAPSYYVFDNGDDNGFTIVSGDDQWPEIVGYSAHGNSEQALQAEGCADFLEAYEQMVEAANSGDTLAKRMLAERKALSANASYKQPKVMPLLGDIAWNQSEPFNNWCPEYQRGKKCATGCVATAMAQVMMYYKYPKELKEDIPAYRSYSIATDMPAIAKGETYDWDNMRPNYSSNYTQAQADAVAKLMLHCGESVQMRYGASSAASLTPSTLVKYFGYDADLVQNLYRSSYTLEEWSKLIDREMVAARPVLYSGASSTSGHQYICDGTDGNGLYHINWGWGGLSDGYYDITILNPSNRGAGAGTGSDGYKRSCSMIIGIAPDNGVADEPLVEHKSLSVTASYEDRVIIVKGERTDASANFTVKLSVSCGNPTDQDFHGLFAIGIKGSDGSYTPVSESIALNLPKMLEDGTYYLNHSDFTFDYAFPIGITSLYGVYSTDSGESWHACDNARDPVFFEVEATATTLTVSGDRLSAELTGPDEIYSDQDNYFEVTLTNGSPHEYLGTIGVYTNKDDKLPSFVTTAADVDEYACIPAGGQTKIIFSLKPQAGDLYVWITDRYYNAIGDAHKFSVIQSEEPILVMTSKKVNVTPGDYENDSAYYYANTKVKMPRINADKAEITYSIRNDGGTYRTDFQLYAFGFDSTSNPCYYSQSQQVLLPGGGTTTDVNFTVSPDQLNGCKSFRTQLITQKDLDQSAIDEERLYLVDKPFNYYIVAGSELVGYIAGASGTGIEQVAERNGLRISVNAGMASILSSENKTVSVFQANGQLAAKANISAGIPATISLRPGIYIVEGMKIAVK